MTKESNPQTMFESILNSMEVFISVCDAENFDILFLNDSIKNYFNIKDGIGQKCHKLVPGLDDPCPACPCFQLRSKPDETIIWEQEEQNHTLRKTARFIDWSDGKKAHLEYAIDITELKNMQKIIEHQNTVLLAISYVSSVLLQSNSDTIERDLLQSMEIMGKAADVDRVYIFENHAKEEGLFAAQIYEWSGGAEPQQEKDLLHSVSYKDVMPNWEEILSRGDCINGPVSGQPSGAKEILAEQGVLSILVVPIFLQKRFWGFVGFDDCRNEREFLKSEVEILRSASELIANAFIRNSMEQNIQHLKKEIDKIYYDPLTGIYNRRYFDETMERIIHTLSRSEGTLSLMMIDIDFFKKYNDNYGHLKGDECLKIIAETLQNSITRKGDFVARYGGEEFVIILPNANEIGAVLIAERMIESIRNKNIPHEENSDEKRVTVSIGITSGTVNPTTTMEDFIHRADKMLYESKRNGRNTYTFASM